MKVTVVLIALMVSISTALPVVISPNYIEARGTEDVAAKRSFVLPDTIRSVNSPRDVVDEFNKREPLGTGLPKNSGGTFKRKPLGTGFSKNSGGGFKREPLGVAFLSLTVGHNPSATVSVPVPRDSTNLPIDSEGTAWSFVAINMGVCVVDLVDSTSIVLGGVNELSADVTPPRAVVGVTCQ